MMLTIEADEAWWPPTFTPDGVSRTLFAWWTMLVASQSTRRCTASRSSIEGVLSSCAVGAAAALMRRRCRTVTPDTTETQPRAHPRKTVHSKTGFGSVSCVSPSLDVDGIDHQILELLQSDA